MNELRNSQRINYKATYVQTKPGEYRPHDEQPRTPRERERQGTKTTRAVEKAAFAQALGVTSTELTAIRKRLLEGRASPAMKKERRLTIDAIKRLTDDPSLTSTINNAKYFAELTPKSLTEVARHVRDERERVLSEVTKIVEIVSGEYLKAKIAPPTPTIAAALPRMAEVTPSTTMRTTIAGIPVEIARAALPKVSGSKPTSSEAAARSIHRNSSTVNSLPDIDEAPAVSINVPTRSMIKTTQLDEVLGWASKKLPNAFQALLKLLRPYSTQPPVLLSARPEITTVVDGLIRLQASAGSVGAALSSFQDRMNIEPVGRLHLERIQMSPAGIERGELVHSVPLTPKETVNISHREWSVRQEEFENIVQDFFEGYSEEGVAEKNDLAQSNEAQSKHATALNVGASLSASYSSVTLSSSFGYSSTSDDQESKKDSRNHSMAITKKASARVKKDHKFSFKVSSVAGTEDLAVRTITNPSESAVRVDYFQLVRKWKVDLYRYGLRMTYDIVIPHPGSALMTKLQRISELDALIDLPFKFDLPLDGITYNSLATDPLLISNYDKLAAKYSATVTPPPEATKWVPVHTETDEDVKNYDHVHYGSIEFDVEDDYYIYQIQYDFGCQTDENENRWYFNFLNDDPNIWGPEKMIGKSGKQALDFTYQYVWTYAVHIMFRLRPKVEALLAWRIKVWNELRQAAEEQYIKSRQILKDERAKLLEEINGYDALTLRRMEQEEIMKGVLRWLFGPSFKLVPSTIAALFSSLDSNDASVKEVLDPNTLSDSQWLDIMEHGEFIKYIHNAIEWENVLYFTYPYFWDKNGKWEFKKFLHHPDSRHRTFLKSGAARVVLTIRPGFEASFTQLIETGAFSALGTGLYVSIAEEIQNFAKTNYPGFPPANPEQNARPLLYPRQRQAWTYMQDLAKRLEAFKVASPSGSYPTTAQGLAALPGAVAKDPWGNEYVYISPALNGEYDLVSLGADGAAGGEDENADISINAEASLIATWFEYTPTAALDIVMTSKLTEMA